GGDAFLPAVAARAGAGLEALEGPAARRGAAGGVVAGHCAALGLHHRRAGLDAGLLPRGHARLGAAAGSMAGSRLAGTCVARCAAALAALAAVGVVRRRPAPAAVLGPPLDAGVGHRPGRMGDRAGAARGAAPEFTTRVDVLAACPGVAG